MSLRLKIRLRSCMYETDYTGLKKSQEKLLSIQLDFLLLKTNMKPIFSHHVKILQNFLKNA